MGRRYLLGIVLLVALLAAPVAAAKTFVVRDHGTVSIAGTSLVCKVYWVATLAGVACIADPSDHPPKGTLAIYVSSVIVTTNEIVSGSSRPKQLDLRRQPQAKIAVDDVKLKGGGDQHVTLHDGDVAVVSGAPILVTALSVPGVGETAFLAPVSKTGGVVVGAYGAGLSAKRAVVQRFVTAAGSSKTVFSRDDLG